MHNVKKTFVVGDEWLYYKIYCGVKTADIVLLEVLKPLTTELLQEKIIDKWFFIRYRDPNSHLRFRIKLLDITNLGEVLIKIKKLLQPFLDNNQVWDIQLGTYQREVKRYGINTIEEAESFFYDDSKMIVTIIETSKDDETRFLTLFYWIEAIIKSFNFEDKKKLSFLEKMQEQFKEEFRVDKTVRKELSNKYRTLETKLLNEKTFNFSDKYNLKDTMERFLMLNKESKLQITLDYLLASFIHMSINRCFRSKQRLFEMMIYDFLYRKNKSKFMRYGKL